MNIHLVKTILMIIGGALMMINPIAIAGIKTWRRDKNQIDEKPYYDKATIRLWRGFGIAATILGVWFLLKDLKIL